MELPHKKHTVFFVANDGTHGRELWKTDGTEGGTMLVRDIGPRSPGVLPLPTGNRGWRGTLAANDGIHGSELWVSDGTPTGDDVGEGPETWVSRFSASACGVRTRWPRWPGGSLFFDVESDSRPPPIVGK